ncbi:monovalent cation/H+ antiporter subunit D [Inhella sp.]|uniref:monovalent cation/H+ antiporter subunit D n=1 Tax=Inhella sp. TaxID=1921806 RepID=UPI0035B32FC7
MATETPVNHWVIAPIVLPLLAGGLLLLLEKADSRWVRPVSLAAVVALLGIAGQLLQQADSGTVQAYLLGNWKAPFGIALALDRLSSLMLLLTAVLAVAALLYACGGSTGDGDRRGAHFHALFHFQLMGVNGAFLTADLFNLFVFFEVLLAASYGLLLHGASSERVKASLHYVVFNLTGSALFLIAVSLLYAVTGTLNMADLAAKLPQVPPQDVKLAQAAGLMLAVVFAIKAALLPLYFWLPATYAAAPAAVACLFAIMTKVGIYCLARASTLLFGDGQGGVSQLLAPLLPWVGLLTLVLAAIGALAARRLRVMVAYLVVGSAGTLLLALGLGTQAALTAGLFYLVNSTWVAGLWFLLADRIAWARGGDDALTPRTLQHGWKGLGATFFVAAVAVAGVPPLAGFMGKALLLQAAGATSMAGWVVSLVLASSLLLMVALGRAGSTLFWKPAGAPAPLRMDPPDASQLLALLGLLGAVLACAVAAQPLARYAEATAEQMLDRSAYLQAVLGAEPVPPAHDVRKEMRERGELK